MSAVVEVLQKLSELVETAPPYFRFIAYPLDKLIVQTDRSVPRALQNMMLMLIERPSPLLNSFSSSSTQYSSKIDFFPSRANPKETPLFTPSH